MKAIRDALSEVWQLIKKPESKSMTDTTEGNDAEPDTTERDDTEQCRRHDWRCVGGANTPSRREIQFDCRRGCGASKTFDGYFHSDFARRRWEMETNQLVEDLEAGKYEDIKETRNGPDIVPRDRDDTPDEGTAPFTLENCLRRGDTDQKGER